LFTLSILPVLAWKTAGWIGLDRWLLSLLGATWQPGTLFQRRRPRRSEA
jgi:thiosulfate dehydrogenase [quinone] large subunit